MPYKIATDDLSHMEDNVDLLHYVHMQNRIERQLLILKVRDRSFYAVAEVFHITENGVILGRNGKIEVRPEGAENASDKALWHEFL